MKVFGKGFFDLADFISSNVLLPIGGIGIAIVLAWRWKKNDVSTELAKEGVGKKWYQDAVYLAIKIVAHCHHRRAPERTGAVRGAVDPRDPAEALLCPAGLTRRAHRPTLVGWRCS